MIAPYPYATQPESRPHPVSNAATRT
jgi:hypothetical protein